MAGNNITNLSGLALAEYIPKRLTENGDIVEKLAQHFDGDERYVLGILDFLKEMG